MEHNILFYMKFVRQDLDVFCLTNLLICSLIPVGIIAYCVVGIIAYSAVSQSGSLLLATLRGDGGGVMFSRFKYSYRGDRI